MNKPTNELQPGPPFRKNISGSDDAFPSDSTNLKSFRTDILSLLYPNMIIPVMIKIFISRIQISRIMFELDPEIYAWQISDFLS